ncbi:MAG TPA: hypothetical protein VKD08_03155 [Ignavibacteriaceae bacterium]|jgi:predicted RNase H-like HicB family nuclease|nr:hypothetical protein [Ignavibacteriaceae bacterium]
MILDIIVMKTDDGYTAEIPGLKGCESWAHDEDTVMEKIIELAAYYLKIDSRDKFKIDRSRTGKNKIIYKLVFNKSNL